MNNLPNEISKALIKIMGSVVLSLYNTRPTEKSEGLRKSLKMTKELEIKYPDCNKPVYPPPDLCVA